MSNTYQNQDLYRYTMARLNAQRRGIVFELSFNSWFWLWLKSGHYKERGKRRGQYVMARNNDEGPYALGNVKIIKTEQNISEGQANRDGLTEAGRLAISFAQATRPHPELAALNRSRTGQPLSQAHRDSIARGTTGKKRGPYNLKGRRNG